jgi:hypothetical protein
MKARREMLGFIDCTFFSKAPSGFCRSTSYSTPDQRSQTRMSNDAKNQLFVYEHDASRLELLIRILYWILIGIVMWVYGIIACICLFIQWFHILVLGRRNDSLSNFAKGYLEYMVHVMGYMYFMTDRRPGILPVPVRIYEEEREKNT